eukprot:m.32553 g.32553  ORF g.32553 m.32553 type:complete len:577 (-) comp8426_c0_seq1:22-1752(-)
MSSGRTQWNVACFCVDVHRLEMLQGKKMTDVTLEDWLNSACETWSNETILPDLVVIAQFGVFSSVISSGKVFKDGYVMIDGTSTKTPKDVSFALFATPTTNAEIRDVNTCVLDGTNAQLSIRLQKTNLAFVAARVQCGQEEIIPIIMNPRDTCATPVIGFFETEPTIMLPVAHTQECINQLVISQEWNTLATYDSVSKVLASNPNLSEPEIAYPSPTLPEKVSWPDRIIASGCEFADFNGNMKESSYACFSLQGGIEPGIMSLAIIKAEHTNLSVSDHHDNDDYNAVETVDTETMMQNVLFGLENLAEPIQRKVLEQSLLLGLFTPNEMQSLQLKMLQNAKTSNLPTKTGENEGGKGFFGRVIDIIYPTKRTKLPEPTSSGIDLVAQCFTWIEKHGLSDEGIYRLAGSQTRVAQLYQDLFVRDHANVEFLLDKEEPRTVATMVKRYFRNLPETLLTGCSYEEWVSAGQGFKGVAGREDNEAQEKLIECFAKMPTPNQYLLCLLVNHLAKVAANAAENKMKIKNLAVVFGPTLLRCPDSDILDSKAVVAGNKIVACLMAMQPKLALLCPKNPFESIV